MATLFGDTGIGWYGSAKEFVIYDPARRSPRGKLARSLRDHKHRAADKSPARSRFEYRFMKESAIRGLAEWLDERDEGLPIRSEDGDIRYYGIDHHRLHQVLAHKIRELEPEPILIGLGGPYKKGLPNLGLYQLKEHREMYDFIRATYSEREYAKIQRLVAELETRTACLNLLPLIWPKPRLRPELRQALLVQRKEMEVCQAVEEIRT